MNNKTLLLRQIHPAFMRSLTKGLIERMTLPFAFKYNYLSPNSKITYRGSRVLILTWVVADIALQSWVSPWTVFYALMAISAYILAWRVPPLMGAAVAGVQLVRVLVGFIIVLILKSGVSSSLGVTLEWVLVGIQFWVLMATLGLVLKYIRTPKKLMKEHVSGLKEK